MTRLPKRFIGVYAFVAGGLLLIVALAPVAAQQTSGIDGQVAVRSDGAVYLIANGQRRWVATVAITDEELNAYPEAEPIYTGLAPMGSPATTDPQSLALGTAPGSLSSPPPSFAVNTSFSEVYMACCEAGGVHSYQPRAMATVSAAILPTIRGASTTLRELSSPSVASRPS